MTYKLEDGRPTTADDPKRLLWYGFCTFWTDDWSKILTVGSGIPCCPTCKRQGFQITARQWFEGAEKYGKDHPGYTGFLLQMKEECHRDKGFEELFGEWKANIPF